VAWYGGRQARAAPLKDPNLWRRESASPNVKKKVRERTIGNVIYLAESRGTGQGVMCKGRENGRKTNTDSVRR
jgi:hypothetical protein